MPSKKDFDAVVVGSGPNGLSAAVFLQSAGLNVLLLESKSKIGGGLRTAELTLPGFHHDICAAVHPMAAVSPYLKLLPLEQYGMKYIFPSIAAAHPFDDGSAAMLYNSLEETARKLGEDERNYLNYFTDLQNDWTRLKEAILGPLRFPNEPFAYIKFGMKALPSALSTAKKFRSKKARGLWAGLAAHAIQPLSNFTTSAVGIVLALTAHERGWPIIKGGSQYLANALEKIFVEAGGKIETGYHVKSLKDIPSCRAVLLDVTPRQLLTIAGHKLSSLYKWQLERYNYGMGVFKMDWALDGPIPFAAGDCSKASTIHIGNTLEEIALSELDTSRGRTPDQPFLLLTQPTAFDESRAPAGKHIAWAYCHVPNGSTTNMTEAIEKQVERFAPGFRERIIGRHSFNTKQLEDYNPNYIGGDINGGKMNITQLFTRPALRFSPYRTSAKGIYICSSSTPPGGGVHGMCGYHAAARALRDLKASK